jgi:RHS repeat-associated protein
LTGGTTICPEVDPDSGFCSFPAKPPFRRAFSAVFARAAILLALCLLPLRGIASRVSEGRQAATSIHDPLGEALDARGRMATANPWRWATKYRDPETGLIYFGRRYYDPVTGQWLSREPLGEDESLNLYAYCHNDPVNNVDRLGLATVFVGGESHDSFIDLLDGSGDSFGPTRGVVSLVDQLTMSLNTGLFATAAVLSEVDFSFLEGYENYRLLGLIANSYQNNRRLAELDIIEAAAWAEARGIWTDFWFDAAGTLDPSPAADIANTRRLYGERRFVEGTLTAVGVIPVAGDLAGKGTKAVGKGIKGSFEWLLDTTTDLGRYRQAANNVAGSALRINPTGGGMNCVNCAIATDAKLAGNLASAMPGRATPISVLEKTFGGSFQTVSGPMEIGSILSQAGNGARGIVYGASKTGNVGHVWNVINQGGTIRFLDGQSGATAAKALGNFDDFANFRFLHTNP